MRNQQTVFNNFLSKTLNPKSDSDQHLVTIFGLVLQTQAKNLLELGVRWGDTSEPMVVGTSMVGGHLTAVDISPTMWVCPEDLKLHYDFIQSDAISFLEKEVEKGSYYDFVYVDDWHAYKHVKQELELIDKITDKKSLILLHDLMAGTYPEYSLPTWNGPESEFAEGGPAAAVFELDLNKWEYVTIPVNNGLTILRKK
jgi:predicted O-methyltransferase YrrM